LANLNISVTADTTQLRAQLALAQADSRAFAAEMRNLASQIRSGMGDSGALTQSLERVSAAFNVSAGHIAELRRGLSGVKEPAGEAAFSMKALGEEVERLPLGLGELGKQFLAVFSAEKIIEWTKALAEGGEQMVKLAAGLGTDVDKAAQFSETLRILGVEAASSERALLRLTESREKAIAAPTGQQAQEFKALFGANWQSQLEQLQDPVDLFNAVREAMGQLDDATQRSIGVALLGVRGWGQLAKALVASNEDWAKSTAEVEKSGAALRGANKDLDGAAEEFKKLDGAIKGLSVTLYEHFKTSIDDSITSLKDIVTEIKNATSGTESWVDVLRAIDPGDFQFIRQDSGTDRSIGQGRGRLSVSALDLARGAGGNRGDWVYA
jgi:hypothetical protein